LFYIFDSFLMAHRVSRSAFSLPFAFVSLDGKAWQFRDTHIHLHDLTEGLGAGEEEKPERKIIYWKNSRVPITLT
jgi:hypothetical protein